MWDATIKLLTSHDVPNFYRLLGVDVDRRHLPTETASPRVLRLDHVSIDRDGQQILHMEFQASASDMRWRMLEYFLAVVRQHSIKPDDKIKVQQILFLVSGNTDARNVIKRHAMSYGYQVQRLDQLDPQGTLLRSRNCFEAVFGLLCTAPLDDAHWETVLSRIDRTRGRDGNLARDAAALLIVVADLLRVGGRIKSKVKELGMDLRVEEGSLVGEMLTQRDKHILKAIIHEGVNLRSISVSDAETEWLEAASTDELRSAVSRLMAGDELFPDRHSLTPSSLGE